MSVDTPLFPKSRARYARSRPLSAPGFLEDYGWPTHQSGVILDPEPNTKRSEPPIERGIHGSKERTIVAFVVLELFHLSQHDLAVGPRRSGSPLDEFLENPADSRPTSQGDPSTTGSSRTALAAKATLPGRAALGNRRRVETARQGRLSGDDRLGVPTKPPPRLKGSRGRLARPSGTPTFGSRASAKATKSSARSRTHSSSSRISTLRNSTG